MKQLTEYSKGGRDFRLVTRDGDIAIFQHGVFRHYEVIIIQRHRGREIAGKTFPPAEFPPSSEQWGSKGWTYTEFTPAIRKYDALIGERESRKDPP